MLLPDRVVQALNLNLEAMEAQTQIQSRSTMAFTPEYGIPTCLSFLDVDLTLYHGIKAINHMLKSPN